MLRHLSCAHQSRCPDSKVVVLEMNMDTRRCHETESRLVVLPKVHRAHMLLFELGDKLFGRATHIGMTFDSSNLSWMKTSQSDGMLVTIRVYFLITSDLWDEIDGITLGLVNRQLGNVTDCFLSVSLASGYDLISGTR